MRKTILTLSAAALAVTGGVAYAQKGERADTNGDGVITLAEMQAKSAERFARMDAAIQAAETMPPDITRSGAGDFLTDMLAEDQEDGVTRIVMHSVVWQYIPAHERDRINTLMETSGAAATDEAPLAWVSLEANRDTHRHELSVRYWPGGEEWTKLGTAHPHGEWVEWDL